LVATTNPEQKDQNADIDEDEAVTVHENDHDGKVTFESEASQEELRSAAWTR